MEGQPAVLQSYLFRVYGKIKCRDLQSVILAPEHIFQLYLQQLPYLRVGRRESRQTIFKFLSFFYLSESRLYAHSNFRLWLTRKL